MHLYIFIRVCLCGKQGHDAESIYLFPDSKVMIHNLGPDLSPLEQIGITDLSLIQSRPYPDPEAPRIQSVHEAPYPTRIRFEPASSWLCKVL